MPQIYFYTMEHQWRGQPHVHGLIFYPHEEFDPRADLRIHYNSGVIHRSVDECKSLVMFVCE